MIYRIFDFDYDDRTINQIMRAAIDDRIDFRGEWIYLSGNLDYEDYSVYWSRDLLNQAWLCFDFFNRPDGVYIWMGYHWERRSGEPYSRRPR